MPTASLLDSGPVVHFFYFAVISRILNMNNNAYTSKPHIDGWKHEYKAKDVLSVVSPI